MAAKDDSGILVEERLPDSCARVARDELLTQPADVLVLAAGSYVVGGDVAAHVQAPVIVEGANMALTPDAIGALRARSVRVVPDVVANSASAALVGHQIASGNTLPPGALWADIEANIKRNTATVERLAKQLDIDTKSAFRRLTGGGVERALQQSTEAFDKRHTKLQRSHHG